VSSSVRIGGASWTRSTPPSNSNDEPRHACHGRLDSRGQPGRPALSQTVVTETGPRRRPDVTRGAIWRDIAAQCGGNGRTTGARRAVVRIGSVTGPSAAAVFQIGRSVGPLNPGVS
jgi:hypothetical protein